jgi:NTE family protein
MDGKDMRDEIDRLTNRANFEYDLKIPFKAVATDLITGEKVVIDTGRISNAIAASASVPGIFIPFKFEDKMLVDGGLVDPVPVDVVREMGADIVIGVSLKDIQVDTPPDVSNIISILSRSIYIMLEELNDVSSSKADIIIKPEYRGPLSYNLSKDDRIKLIKLGEEETKKIIPLLKKLINSY